MATIAGAAVATVGLPALTRSVAAQQEGCVITCPYYPSADTDPGTCSGEVTWDPPVDNGQCGQNPVIICDHQSGETFPGNQGTSVNCYLQSDESVTCSFYAEVYDNEEPVITCPGDIYEVVTGPTAVSFDDPVVSDNCGTSGLTWDCDYNSGDTFPIGTTTVTCEAQYIPSGKRPTPTCTFDITLVVPTETATAEPSETPTDVPTDQPTSVDPTATIPVTESPATTVPDPSATPTTAPVTSLPNTGSGNPSSGASKLLPIAIVGGGAALLTRLGLRARSEDSNS